MKPKPFVSDTQPSPWPRERKMRPPAPGMSTVLHIVANPDAGHGIAGDPLKQAIKAHPRLSRHPLRWHVPARGERLDAVCERASRAAARDRGAVVAAGGDGTVSAVAQAAWRAGAPLGVISLGTFNYFCREHGLPHELEPALDALSTALDTQSMLPVRVGLLNDRVFVVNASIGAYPRLLDEREAAKQRFGRYRWVALLSAAFALLRPTRPMQLALQDHPPTVRERAWEVSTLFIGANARQLDDVGLPHATEVREGRLALVMLAAQDRWSTLRVLWRAWRGRLVSEESIASTALDGLDVTPQGRHRRRSLRVACDGETALMRAPLLVRVGGHPLWLLAPAAVETSAEAETAAASLDEAEPARDLAAGLGAPQPVAP